MKCRIRITNLPFSGDYIALVQDIRISCGVSQFSSSIPTFPDGRQRGYIILEFESLAEDKADEIVAYVNGLKFGGKVQQASILWSGIFPRSFTERKFARDRKNFRYSDDDCSDSEDDERHNRRRDREERWDPSYSPIGRRMAYPYSFSSSFRMDFIKKHQSPQEAQDHCVHCSNPSCARGTVSENGVHLDHNPSLAERFSRGEHRFSEEERRISFFDESRLQILCSSCNEHKGGEGYHYQDEHLRAMRH